MNRPPSSGRKTHDRGTAAVEFALVLPVLLLIVFGIVDFGRALNAQLTLTGAAREGVRLAALGYTDAAIQARVAAAAPGLRGVARRTSGTPGGRRLTSETAGARRYGSISVTRPTVRFCGLFAVWAAPAWHSVA